MGNIIQALVGLRAMWVVLRDFRDGLGVVVVTLSLGAFKVRACCQLVQLSSSQSSSMVSASAAINSRRCSMTLPPGLQCDLFENEASEPLNENEHELYEYCKAVLKNLSQLSSNKTGWSEFCFGNSI